MSDKPSVAEHTQHLEVFDASAQKLVDLYPGLRIHVEITFPEEPNKTLVKTYTSTVVKN